MEGEAEGEGSTPMDKYQAVFNQRLQLYLDKSTPHVKARWGGGAAMILLYMLRVYLIAGFYIITYALGIYLLHLFIGFLSPKTDIDRPLLPTGDSESKGFERRLSEFKMWWSLVKAVGLSFVLTFIPFFDIPVFWPILVIYFFALCFMTMRRQVAHMMKHKYIPFDLGKKVYKETDKSSEPLPGTTPTADEATVVSAPKSFTPPPGFTAPPQGKGM